MAAVDLSEFERFLFDSSVLFRFFEGGAPCTERLCAFLGESLYVVDSVHQEIVGHLQDPDKKDAIDHFLNALSNEPLEPPPEVLREVERQQRLNRNLSLPINEDIDEIETVHYADWALRVESIEYLLLIQDRTGRAQAELRDLPCANAFEFLRHLVQRGALTAAEAEPVAQSIFKGAFDRDLYYESVA